MVPLHAMSVQRDGECSGALLRSLVRVTTAVQAQMLVAMPVQAENIAWRYQQALPAQVLEDVAHVDRGA